MVTDSCRSSGLSVCEIVTITACSHINATIPDANPAALLARTRMQTLTLRPQVMLRVGDLDKSIQYYTEALGMKLLRRKDVESQKYTLAFLGYGEEDDNVAIELT